MPDGNKFEGSDWPQVRQYWMNKNSIVEADTEPESLTKPDVRSIKRTLKGC